jgi:ribosomal protein S18 acetylase RimI-like enzyme
MKAVKNMLRIRKYDPAQDEGALRELLLELLDFEKSVESEWPSGPEIIEPYFRWMMKHCRDYSEEIFVADEDGNVLGFITVLGRFLPIDPDEYPKEYAFISELLVHKPHRGRGLGHQLIAEAEKYALQQGVSTIRLEATANNTLARKFYTRAGFRELVVEYFKRLR